MKTIRQPKLPKSQERYEFKKGESVHLDDIYNIQALCKGNWWKHVYDEDHTRAFTSDDCIITRDITICITEF